MVRSVAKARFGHKPSVGEQVIAKLYLLEQMSKALHRHARLQVMANQVQLARAASEKAWVPLLSQMASDVGEVLQSFMSPEQHEEMMAAVRDRLNRETGAWA